MQNGGKAMSYQNTHMVSMGKSYSYGVITFLFPMPMTCACLQGTRGHKLFSSRVHLLLKSFKMLISEIKHMVASKVELYLQ